MTSRIYTCMIGKLLAFAHKKRDFKEGLCSVFLLAVQGFACGKSVIVAFPGHTDLLYC